MDSKPNTPQVQADNSRVPRLVITGIHIPDHLERAKQDTMKVVEVLALAEWERTEVRRLSWDLIRACDRLLMTCEGTAEDRDAVYQAKDALRLALFGPMRVGRDVEVKNA